MGLAEAAPGALLLAVSGAVACAGAANPPAPLSVAQAPAPAAPSASSSAAANDDASALARVERGCDGGSPRDCNELALAFLEGRSGAQIDRARAARVFERGCELGGAGACGNLGFLFKEGVGVPQDTVRAIGLLTRACDGAWWEGCRLLGDLYFSGDHEDLPRAFLVVDRACKAGHQRSCGSAGILLTLAKGVPKDLERALTLSDRACAAGVAFACTNLGNVLVESAADLARVRAAYQQGCTDDNPAGCYVFGAMCATGKLGKADVSRAEPLFRRACDHGHEAACATLERRREKGER